MAAIDDRERLAQVEVRVEEQGGRIIELSQQIKDLDRKVDRLSDRFDGKFDGLDGKLDGLRSEMAKQFRWTIGVMLTLAGLVVALGR